MAVCKKRCLGLSDFQTAQPASRLPVLSEVVSAAICEAGTLQAPLLIVDVVTVVTLLHKLGSAWCGSRQWWLTCLFTHRRLPHACNASYKVVVHLRNGFSDVFSGLEASWSNLCFTIVSLTLVVLTSFLKGSVSIQLANWELSPIQATSQTNLGYRFWSLLLGVGENRARNSVMR